MRSLLPIVVVVLLAIATNLTPAVDLTIWGKRIFRSLELKLGLDLAGGSHLVYQADTSALAPNDRPQAIEATRANIERRVNLLGVAEPLIQTAKIGDDYRLIVELAGVTDVASAVDLIGQTAQLEFRETTVATPSSLADFAPSGLTGADLRRAAVEFGGESQASRGPVVSLEFSQEGTAKFAQITQRSLGKPLAIFLDSRSLIVPPPTVQNVITDGRAVISGGFTVDQAKKLTIQLNAGALPVPLQIVEQRHVGATLGHQSLAKSLVAGGIGFLLVWLFMAVNYGGRGLLANLALVIYVLVSLALIRLIPITLTLAGITALVLSIGMAVDANILIFERIKEELRWGRPTKAAMELGFHRAWSSIRDSNFSSLITAAILFWFGTGAVRGFALTLIVGIGVSLFSSITVTRTLLRLIYRK